MFFALSGAHTWACGSSIILQLPPHLSTLTVNEYLRDSSGDISTNVGLAWYGQLFKDTHFIGPLELETNDLLKAPIVKGLNNPIIFYSSNPDITYYHGFSSDFCKYW